MSNERKDPGQTRLSTKALAMKAAGDSQPDHPRAGEHASAGIKSKPRPDYPPSGAFEAEGHRPVLERTRKER